MNKTLLLITLTSRNTRLNKIWAYIIIDTNTIVKGKNVNSFPKINLDFDNIVMITVIADERLYTALIIVWQNASLTEITIQ